MMINLSRFMIFPTVEQVETERAQDDTVYVTYCVHWKVYWHKDSVANLLYIVQLKSN